MTILMPNAPIPSIFVSEKTLPYKTVTGVAEPTKPSDLVACSTTEATHLGQTYDIQGGRAGFFGFQLTGNPIKFEKDAVETITSIAQLMDMTGNPAFAGAFLRQASDLYGEKLNGYLKDYRVATGRAHPMEQSGKIKEMASRISAGFAAAASTLEDINAENQKFGSFGQTLIAAYIDGSKPEQGRSGNVR